MYPVSKLTDPEHPGKHLAEIVGQSAREVGSRLRAPDLFRMVSGHRNEAENRSGKFKLSFRIEKKEPVGRAV